MFFFLKCLLTYLSFIFYFKNVISFEFVNTAPLLFTPNLRFSYDFQRTSTYTVNIFTVMVVKNKN